MLSKHGPFDSKSVHKHAITGTKEHKENMEDVAREMEKCIREGSFGGRSLMCFRDISPDQWVFSDEEELQAFLAMNEDSKQTYVPSTYSVVDGSMLKTMFLLGSGLSV